MTDKGINAHTSEIGITALQLGRKLEAVEVFAYRLVFDNPPDQEPIRLIRRGAMQLGFANRYVPITNLDAWNVVSLTRLDTLISDWKGVRCRATDERAIVLHSDHDAEREAIQRLLNLALMRGAKALARDSGGRLEAGYGAGNRVELTDRQPSERLRIRSAYLDAFKTVALMPEILPDGTAWVEFHVRHRILPMPEITLDWVLRHRREWLEQNGIRRVRHRYELPGKGHLTAEWVGVANRKTPMSRFHTPEGEFSYFDYHLKRGHIPKGEEELARTTAVVTLRYGKNKDTVHHLASLLQPLFDFETLQNIDSPLLERISRRLRWPVHDRLKVAAEMIRGLHIPYWNATLNRIKKTEKYTRSLKPNVRLKFADGEHATDEKAVLRLGAYRGMTRKRVVPLIVTEDASEVEYARRHFSEVKRICDRWSGGESPAWTPAPVVRNSAELEARLSGKDFSDTILIIGLGKGADKHRLRDVAFRHGMATQFMRLDHPRSVYRPSYYNNLAAGLFSKAGGIICALDDMPGDTELFVGLDLGGTGQRIPGIAFLFTREGFQLGWQLAEAQRGERISDDVLRELLERSLNAFKNAHKGRKPARIALHRDGRFFESMTVIHDFEQKYGVGVDVLEVIKSGTPPLFRRSVDPKGGTRYRNPEVGDAFLLQGLDEMIVSTYSGDELGSSWGKSVTVRPLRLRKRYGATDLLILAQQVILLSRIHGASLYRHPRLPVTIHHADRFATLRQECNLDDLSKMDRLCPVYL